MNKILVILDQGHGLDTPGKRTPLFDDGTFMKENEFNRDVAQKIFYNLERYENIDVFVSTTEKSDIDLSERIKRINQVYDLYKSKNDNVKCVLISIHANAFNGIWGNQNGTSTHYYPTNMEDKAFAEVINKNLVENLGLRNRGNIGSDFMIIRECKMTACLCECAFMDNRIEASLLTSSDFRNKCAEGITKGLLEYLNIKVESRCETKYKYTETTNGTRQIFLPVEELKIDIFDNKQGNKSFANKYKFAINGTLFGGTTCSVVPLMANGNYNTAKCRWGSNHGKAQSCIIINKDNTVEMVKLNSIADLGNKLYSAKHIIGGIGLINTKDKNFTYDPVSEGYTNRNELAGLERKCNKTVLAFIEETNEIVLMTRQNIHHTSGYNLIQLCKDCGYTYAISLDGGGSTFMIANGDYRLRGDGRGIFSVLYAE